MSLILVFFCLWTLVVGWVTWRQLSAGQIKLLGDALVIRRSDRPILFWWCVAGGLACVAIGVATIIGATIALLT
jgi:hypothetical protein